MNREETIRKTLLDLAILKAENQFEINNNKTLVDELMKRHRTNEARTAQLIAA